MNNTALKAFKQAADARVRNKSKKKLEKLSVNIIQCQ